MIDKPTVYVELLDNPVAIQMVWSRYVDKQDVANAFRDINTLLNESSKPLHIIVDLQNNPQMPVAVTLNSALFGPYRNPQLKSWLIIGSSSMGRVVENVLSSVTGRNNVQWFNNPDEVFAYLEAMKAPE